MQINFVTLEENAEFTTPFANLAFANLVYRESCARGDKTWNRCREWSREFHIACGATEHRTVVTDPATVRQYHEFCDAIELVEYHLAGHVVAREGFALWRPWAKGIDTHLVHEGIEYHRAIQHVVNCPPRIIIRDDTGAVIFSSADVHPADDWKIIAELSGQRARRQVRIAVANAGGHMLPVALGIAGVHIPNAPAPELLPLLARDFLPARNGDGFVVIGLGKVMLSKTNTPGYYKVVRETARAKIIALVEEVR